MKQNAPKVTDPRIKEFKEKLSVNYKRMLRRNIRSGTIDYATPRAVFSALLNRLADDKVVYRWAHFEVDRISRGWKKFLSANPCIEVTLASENFFELEHPKKKFPPLPEAWSKTGKRLVKIPVADQSRLIAWIEEFFLKANVKNPNTIMIGWIDGK